MPGSQKMLLWRMAFWVTAIHFGVFAFLLATTSGEIREQLRFPAFPVSELGFFRAAAIWLVANSGAMLCALVLLDALALLAIWKVAHRSRPVRLFGRYIFLAGSFSAVYLSAALYISGRTFDLRAGGFDFSSMTPGTSGIAVLVVSLPLLLVLLALMTKGVPRIDPGLCPACGYDLRATPQRCPECGHVPHKRPAEIHGDPGAIV